MLKRILIVLAPVVALPALAQAPAPAEKAAAKTQATVQSETSEVTATIEAIDHTSRWITLKDAATGELSEIHAGPDVKRFSELKVGDKVTFRYHQSVAYKIRKPGEAGAPASTATSVVPGGGARPGGTMSQQQTETVTVKAIDAAAPSVTVVTGKGRTVSMKVADKAALQSLKVGDKVEITYTEALAISVK